MKIIIVFITSILLYACNDHANSSASDPVENIRRGDSADTKPGATPGLGGDQSASDLSHTPENRNDGEDSSDSKSRTRPAPGLNDAAEDTLGGGK